MAKVDQPINKVKGGPKDKKGKYKGGVKVVDAAGRGDDDDDDDNPMI